MTPTQRAAQIWPILVLCASRRGTLTFEMLSRLVGVPTKLLGEFLEPIQAYCLLEALAPLTAIVVDQATGLPAGGSIRATDVPRAQEEVYAQDWSRISPPSAETLQDASEGMLVRRARDRQMRAVEKTKDQRKADAAKTKRKPLVSRGTGQAS